MPNLIAAIPTDKMKPALIGRNGNAIVVQLMSGEVFCVGDDSADVNAIDFLNGVISVPGNTIADIDGLQAAIDGLQAAINTIQLTPGDKGDPGTKGDKGDPGTSLVAGRDYPIVSASPPANPADKWQWTQIDANGLAIDWIWSATNALWLSRNKYFFGYAGPTNVSATEYQRMQGGAHDQRLLLIESLKASWHHALSAAPGGTPGGVDSATEYWRLVLHRDNSSGTQTYLPSLTVISEQGLNLAAITNLHYVRAIGATLDLRPNAGSKGLSVQIQKFGSNAANTISSVSVSIGYRWVYTP